MTSPRQTRRTVLKAAGAGTLLSSLASGAAAKDDESLDDQLARAEESTKQYADPEAAIDDGFQPMGPFVPGMGWHFINEANVQAAVEDGFDVERPQLLTYGDTGAGCDGELVLGSVEYAIPVGPRDHTEENPPNVFDDEEAEWHIHPGAEHVFVLPVEPESGLPEDFPRSPADASFRDLFRTTNWVEITPGGDPGSPKFEHGEMILADLESRRSLDARAVVGTSVHPDLWTLHAWVHLENPNGVFAERNPDLPVSPTE
ncbi:hypothetical protein G9464_10025 [Halostella sp. JP-L12]|uniref:hypothetical protein n=1 Tax=Halostella TaxID=1843185 RepID=UPI0013CE48B7|nr:MULTISPECIES: hypothetical protein [Halostella]NHN47932.1 hypothetical protein [Halostella sp. JP-L12]